MTSMRSMLVGFGMLLAAAPVSAQSSEEKDVLAVVQKLFDGMRARDTAAMRALLHPQARMASPSMRNGTFSVTVESPDPWLQGLPKAPPGLLDERISNPVVRVDGALASVWVDYAFYLGDKFSHCGVDAFHLVRTPQGWQIIDLADTRRREGCPPP